MLELLNQGINANHEDKFRRKNIVLLPLSGELVITGDLHGHQRNLDRIITYCDLENYPKRHVVFQEIIHGGAKTDEGGCLSYRVLLQVMQYKLRFPDQVHLIIGNHDTAFITNTEVMKDGREMNRAMGLALKQEYAENYDEISQALQDFLFSQPLAVKTANGLWMSHSLPADRWKEEFNPHIFVKPVTIDDCAKPGDVYLLTWGRNMSQPWLNELAATLKTRLFILGHQPQPQGWNQAGDNLLLIASDHNHGCLVHVELEDQLSMEDLIHSIVPLSSIA
ncbi:MAG: metallophosphoesterase [Phycisphaeraceae bacterium]|nr:metallophosphoesterase [Phycisphaeraceae bacterium]